MIKFVSQSQQLQLLDFSELSMENEEFAIEILLKGNNDLAKVRENMCE